MKGQIADLYERITGDASGLEKLLEKIPGLSGYMERGRRREADQLLRDMVAGRLEDARKQLGQVQADLSRDIVKAIYHAEPLGRADSGLMGLIGKIHDAPEGYAGFFDAVKVQEDDLARVYAFDQEMVLHVDTIAEQIEAVDNACRENEDIDGSIRQLDEAIRSANHTFNQRSEVLLGVA